MALMRSLLSGYGVLGGLEAAFAAGVNAKAALFADQPQRKGVTDLAQRGRDLIDRNAARKRDRIGELAACSRRLTLDNDALSAPNDALASIHFDPRNLAALETRLVSAKATRLASNTAGLD